MNNLDLLMNTITSYKTRDMKNQMSLLAQVVADNSASYVLIDTLHNIIKNTTNNKAQQLDPN